MTFWNPICMLTRLPILKGEEVVLFVLRPNFTTPDIFGSYFPNEIFSPLCTPVYCSYNGYDFVDNIESLSSQLFLCYFNVSSDNKEFEFPNTESKYKCDSLLKYFIEDRSTHDFIFVVIKKSIYDKVIDMSRKIEHRSKKEDTDTNTSIYEHISKLFNDIVIELEDLHTAKGKKSLLRLTYQDVISSHRINYYISDFGLHSKQFYSLLNYSVYKFKLQSVRVQVFDLIINTLVFNYMLEVAGLAWSPQTCVGAPYNNTGITEMLARQTIHLCNISNRKNKD